MRDTQAGGLPISEHGLTGVYAFKTLAELKADVGERAPGGYCYGQVKLWGRIVEHEYGYRAEYARVLSLTHGPRLAVWRLRRIYGIGGEVAAV